MLKARVLFKDSFYPDCFGNFNEKAYDYVVEIGSFTAEGLKEAIRKAKTLPEEWEKDEIYGENMFPEFLEQWGKHITGADSFRIVPKETYVATILY